MMPLLVTSGEPAGIGPDLCLALAELALPIVVLADRAVLQGRAKQLQYSVRLLNYNPGFYLQPKAGELVVWSLPCAAPVAAGELNPANSRYVMTMLELAVTHCLQKEFSALITAPVNKAIINQAGIPFTGHTEFLAERCKVAQVVMMLACQTMKVALATTHLPLADVPKAITSELILEVSKQLHHCLQKDFGLQSPKILVAGLNPHAGEGGYLGREEIEVIAPALKQLQAQAIDVRGPYPADTLFTQENMQQADAFLAMYHDQGLPVLKHASFGNAVNITLGLPIIRTSVDHGTALPLAGSGRADSGSLIAAVNMAMQMVAQREKLS